MWLLSVNRSQPVELKTSGYCTVTTPRSGAGKLKPAAAEATQACTLGSGRSPLALEPETEGVALDIEDTIRAAHGLEFHMAEDDPDMVEDD